MDKHQEKAWAWMRQESLKRRLCLVEGPLTIPSLVGQNPQPSIRSQYTLLPQWFTSRLDIRSARLPGSSSYIAIPWSNKGTHLGASFDGLHLNYSPHNCHISSWCPMETTFIFDHTDYPSLASTDASYGAWVEHFWKNSGGGRLFMRPSILRRTQHHRKELCTPQ